MKLSSLRVGMLVAAVLSSGNVGRLKSILFFLMFASSNVSASLVAVTYDVSLTQLQPSTFSTISSWNSSPGLRDITPIQGVVTTTFDLDMPHNNLYPVVWTNTLDYLTPRVPDYNYFYNDNFYARDRLLHYSEYYESENDLFAYQRINIDLILNNSTDLRDYFNSHMLNEDVFEITMINRYYTGEVPNVGIKNIWWGTATISNFTEISTVPAPPALLLMLSGLLALFGITRKEVG